LVGKGGKKGKKKKKITIPFPSFTNVSAPQKGRKKRGEGEETIKSIIFLSSLRKKNKEEEGKGKREKEALLKQPTTSSSSLSLSTPKDPLKEVKEKRRGEEKEKKEKKGGREKTCGERFFLFRP